MQRSSYQRLLGILCSVLDTYSACLFLPAAPHEGEKGQQAYHLAAHFSLGEKIDTDALVAQGRGLVGWILRNAEPLLVVNFDQRQNHLGYYNDNEEQHIKAFMGCPLPGGGGALCVDSKRQYSFSEKDQKMLHLFADLVSRMQAEDATLEKYRSARKYYAALRMIYTLRHHHTRWDDFLRSFLSLLASVSGFSYCSLFTLDQQGQSYSVEGENIALLAQGDASFPIAAGVAGWVFRHSSPVVNCAAHMGADPLLVGKTEGVPTFQTIYALPLVIHRKTRAVLSLAHEHPMEVQDHLKEFVNMAAEHLALFLENLYVKDHLKRLHQQAQQTGSGTQ